MNTFSGFIKCSKMLFPLFLDANGNYSAYDYFVMDKIVPITKEEMAYQCIDCRWCPFPSLPDEMGKESL